MTSAATLWRTVRHLRAKQIFGRVSFRLSRPKPDLRPAPARRRLAGTWHQPATREPSLIGPGRLRVLNEDYDVERQGWDDPSASKLLRYNVHYFEDLIARASKDRDAWQRALVDGWIVANPPGAGTGWEPYPVSLRVVNWIKWFLGGSQVEARWLDSLAAQVRWLRRRLEYHLLGNHLFVNAKALMFAGVYFDGPEAQEWLEAGAAILEREVPEQILADGAQFELSPMYHALALEDVLDLLNLCAVEGAASQRMAFRANLARRTGPMLEWLRAMTHPDGTPGLFNDCAPGIAADLPELEAYAARLGVVASCPRDGIVHFPASGYIRAAWSGATALVDVARIGPDYLPGHAHADTLSFELSVGARRLLVNGGTSLYGTGQERLRERGTAAHNTVAIAEQNSSEVWSGFRVGRRARPLNVEVTTDSVTAAHDGYRYLRGRPLHRRRWQFAPASLLVEDEALPARQSAIARFHLAPGLSLAHVADAHWQVRAGDDVACAIEIIEGEASRESASHATAFGRTVLTDCLAVRLREGRGSARFTWGNDANTFPH